MFRFHLLFLQGKKPPKTKRKETRKIHEGAWKKWQSVKTTASDPHQQNYTDGENHAIVVFALKILYFLATFFWVKYYQKKMNSKIKGFL